MTKPKNIRPRGAHLAGSAKEQPPTRDELWKKRRSPDYDTPVKRQPPEASHINTVEVGALQFADAPGLVMVRLLIDGKPLYLPVRLMTNMPGWVALQLQPQFPCFFTESDAEQFHQQQVAQMAAEKQAQAVALWTPDKARKGLVN